MKWNNNGRECVPAGSSDTHNMLVQQWENASVYRFQYNWPILLVVTAQWNNMNASIRMFSATKKKTLHLFHQGLKFRTFPYIEKKSTKNLKIKNFARNKVDLTRTNSAGWRSRGKWIQRPWSDRGAFMHRDTFSELIWFGYWYQSRAGQINYTLNNAHHIVNVREPFWQKQTWMPASFFWEGKR